MSGRWHYRRMEGIVTQIISHFEELVTLNTATAQEVDKGNVGHVKNANAFVRLFEVKESFASNGATRFKDLPCPICGRFVCGGC
jgi:hypothetical protein